MNIIFKVLNKAGLLRVRESGDNQSGRIKYMLNHPIPIPVKCVLFGLLIIFIFAAILLSLARMTQPGMTVINNGPLDIKLVSICPDGYDLLYDPNGKKIGKLSEFVVAYTDSWSPESQCRDFIFKVPDVQDQLIYATFQKITISENNQNIGGSFRAIYDPVSSSPTLTHSVSFSRSYRRNLVPFLNIDTPIDYVDFSLRYYYGPRREAFYTFIGPFMMDKKINADGNNSSQVTFQASNISFRTGVEMRFQTNEPYENSSDKQVILYDNDGKRYLVGSGDGRSGSNGADLTFREIPLSPAEITAITFGEKPYEITFKNVKVQYSKLPPRNYPEYLDIMAQKLNLSGMTGEQLRQYRFNNPEAAFKVIDIIRSQWHIQQVVETIRFKQPKIQIAELDEATQEKIRQTAFKWAKHSNIEQYGIELGLMGKLPEFFDLAIERLNKNLPENYSYFEMERIWLQANREIMSVMLDYRITTYTSEQINKLKRLILSTNDSNIMQNAFYILDRTKTQETTNALYELAQDDKPWIWWRASERWYSRARTEHIDIDSLPEKMKIRLALISEIPDETDFKEKALLLLTEIFTPELGEMNSEAWNAVRKRIATEFDKKEATEIFINYLRNMQTYITAKQWNSGRSHIWMVSYVIRNLNVWYSLNIGNLGTDETARSSDTEPRNLPAFINLISQALKWYDENQDIEPVELAFTGKVVDTSGNPVAEARMIFTKMEEYLNERGYRNQRRVDVSQIATDANGVYSVVLDPNEKRYEFEVAADGFLTRERLMIHPLDDGRFRFNDRYSKEENLIVMQHPGKISGTVIGADGQPLANTELELFANYQYSFFDSHKTIKTDSQGKFNVDGVSSEPMLLSYKKYIDSRKENRFFRKYEGLCGALIIENKEGQEQSGIMLDLSKSVCSLQLEVTDKEGKPVDSINMYFDIKMPSGSGYLYDSVFHSEEENYDGIYKFEGLPPGKWHLRISKSDFPDKELDIELIPGQTAGYKVTLDKTSSPRSLRGVENTIILP